MQSGVFETAKIASAARSNGSRHAMLLGFVDEQLRPWTGRHWDAGAFSQRQSLLACSVPSIFLFLLDRERVSIVEKTRVQHVTVLDGAFRSRAQLYQSMLQDALVLRPAAVPLVMAIDLGDGATNDYDIPVFTFQKRRGGFAPLLPDMEMVDLDYYETIAPDTLPFGEKQTRAVFAGSTTGGGIITLEAAKAARSPRLRAAAYFQDVDDVDFTLSRLVQCETAEVAAYLVGRGYGGRLVGWPETYQAKFGISIDGNGAPCSRPAILLRSNGVLLKYASEFVLFYSNGLIPGSHYLEVEEDRDVLQIVAAEREQPGRYAGVAKNGQVFGRTFLSREAVLAYTSELIASYAAIAP